MIRSASCRRKTAQIRAFAPRGDYRIRRGVQFCAFINGSVRVFGSEPIDDDTRGADVATLDATILHVDPQQAGDLVRELQRGGLLVRSEKREQDQAGACARTR